MNRREAIILWSAACAILSLSATQLPAETNLEQEVQELRAENAALKEQVQQQGDQLDSLSKKVDSIKSVNGSSSSEDSQMPKGGGFNLGKMNLSGEGGIGFQNTGTEGSAPNSEFRVQEARLFLEAPIWKEVYFYSEVDLATPENNNTSVQLEECYLDFQDVSQLWGHDNQLNFRAGRMNIPFGEEYLTRYAIDNPFVSHSLSDLWGVDPGAELYGTLGKFSYVVAVQNGSGANGTQDFSDDKSVAGRIGYDPNRWLHMSVSGMRTGDVNVQQDHISALWFGNGWFQSIGSPATTMFHANLAEADVTARWKSGYVKAFAGYGRYGDNDPAADNGRNIYYYSAEVVQDLPKQFYAGVRFSQIKVAGGYPLVGYGNMNTYFHQLTTDLWALSLGLGYRFSEQLVVKVEYSLAGGDTTTGDPRNNEDFFGTQVAFKF